MPPEAMARELVVHLDRTMRRFILGGVDRDSAERFSRSEISIVDLLGAEGPMAMGEVAARTRMPLSTATRVVGRLVERGMLERERPEENRRVVRVALAAGGRRFYRAALGARISGAQRMLECLGERDSRELIRLLQKVADSIARTGESEQ
jgi:DNA-binding MarR family transcriptional regulator